MLHCSNWCILVYYWCVCAHSYGAQEMLMRPGSSTRTLSVSTSPPLHSPRALPSYDVVTTTGSSVPYYSHANPPTEASGNGSSSTVVYSETNESMVRLLICNVEKSMNVACCTAKSGGISQYRWWPCHFSPAHPALSVLYYGTNLTSGSELTIYAHVLLD